MKPSVILVAALLVFAGVLVLRMPGWTHPPIQSTDYGPAAGEMVVFKDPRVGPAAAPQPEFMQASFTTALPSATTAPLPGAPLASTAYRNVKVLGGVSKAEFDRTMIAITAWVSPKQGCGYCHAGTDYVAETPRKQLAREMIGMTRTINANWTDHVGARGVTCYSCHSGRNIPANVWHLDPPLVPPEGGLLGKPQAWNTTAKTIRQFFPNRPDRMFLLEGLPANRVQDQYDALAHTGKPNYQHDREYAEQIYILMMQMSNAIGTNCTYCHQSRALFDWSQSPPNRLDGYSGIKMTAMLNQNVFSRLAPLVKQAAPSQIGKMGDAAMVDCKSCHQGQEKPVGGMLHAIYPALIGPVPNGPANPLAAANPTIPELARAPRVGHPETDTVPKFQGERQGTR